MIRCWLFGHKEEVEWLKNKSEWGGWVWDYPYYYCGRCFESNDLYWGPDAYPKYQRNLWHRTVPFWIFRWKNSRMAKRHIKQFEKGRIEHLKKLTEYKYE